jgi:Ethylbenzene dehydrogenase/Carbohydrate family 9 binding domain-like
MKQLQKKVGVIALFIATVTILVHCTKRNQIIEEENSSPGNELISLKTTTAPTIDGTIDAMWNNAAKLNVEPQVPDPGNNLFTGYIGETYSATIRSMYDNQYIYFLVEVPDNNKSVKSAPWYFNPTTQRWAQEPTARTYDASGVLTREGWGEDKLAFQWNVDFSTPKFITQTCYASCHVFTPYLDYSVTPPAMKSNAASGNHYTNGANEKIDMWWAHPNRGLQYGKMDDNYQDWAGGPQVTSLVGGSGNGRHFDDLVVSGASATWPFAPTYTADATQGSANNRQNLKLDGTGATVTVPMWIIPNSTGDFIKVADTLAGGTAVKITGVSSTGVLTYSGGTIDPNVGTDYQRIGDPVTGGDGLKGFPGIIISPVLRGRADIDCIAVYTGTGWIYEFKRLLKTNDVLKQDIDFTSLQDQQFGMAIWNKSNYQHGIKPNLLLKFQK